MDNQQDQTTQPQNVEPTTNQTAVPQTEEKKERVDELDVIGGIFLKGISGAFKKIKNLASKNTRV